MPTQLWAVRAALVELYTSEVDPIAVFDGPVVTTPPKTFVLVGSDGGDTGVGDSVEDGSEYEQTESSMGGNGWRDEVGRITCAAWAWGSPHSSSPASCRAWR